MKKSVGKWILFGLGLAFSSFAFGETGEAVGKNWAPIAAAIAIGMGAFGAASGQGKAASAALEGVARNPGSRGEVFTPLILSLVFMELQALLCFVIAFMVMG